MGKIRTGTVGYSYRDWAGLFYPQGTPPRRQFSIYAHHFDVCELTQFTHQMPDAERVAHFASQIRTDLEVFVRIHNAFTHCADLGLALTVARHFKKAIEPLAEEGRLAGLVAPFPYAFKNTASNREYVQQLAAMLNFGISRPLQLDFRHASWAVPGALGWAADHGLGIVCVDEPNLPGLVAPLVVATSNRVLIRLHGRNSDSWWSGNSATRFDYTYSEAELEELRHRYAALIQREDIQVGFLFQNNWQCQSIRNALQWKELLSQPALAVPDADRNEIHDEFEPVVPFPRPAPSPVPIHDEILGCEDDALRPPTSLPLSEVKSRVSRALSINNESSQESLNLPPREL